MRPGLLGGLRLISIYAIVGERAKRLSDPPRATMNLRGSPTLKIYNKNSFFGPVRSSFVGVKSPRQVEKWGMGQILRARTSTGINCKLASKVFEISSSLLATCGGKKDSVVSACPLSCKNAGRGLGDGKKIMYGLR